MVARLAELGVTRYYWLVWHAATDWDDLKLFLPAAARAHIQTWVYLVPPTEGPTQGYPASEPFKLDYVRWAEAIARLSLEQPSLTGWVIDDFYANSKVFTPAYVQQMQAAAKRVNPRLAFYPLMYFPEITPRFVADYRGVIDGVVVAYPQDREEIVGARAVLNGDTSAIPGELSYPWHSPSQAGEFVSASISGRVLSGRHVRVRFAERDDFLGATSGYHFKQVTVDGAVVWEQDVAGGTKGWEQVDLDLTGRAPAGANVSLAFRLVERKGVGNFGVRWRIRYLHADGLRLSSTAFTSPRWKVDKSGAFVAGFGPQPPPVRGLSPVPFIVMTAASSEEFRLRHGDPATPARMGDWLRICLQASRDGVCDGVVTYCLDKRPQSAFFPVAKSLFWEFSRGHR